MSKPVEFYSAGKTPKVASEHAVAFYDPKTGQVRHLHRAITLEGAKAPDAETATREGVQHAKRLGVSLDGLKTLHIAGPMETNGRFRVDLKTEKLVRLELPPELLLFRGKK